MKSIIFIFLLVGGCGVTVGMTREYIYNSAKLSWSDAQQYCRTNYKDLATITTMEENKQLLQLGSGWYNNWIGLNQALGTWKWSDGEQASFLNWHTGFSILGGECAFIYTKYYSYYNGQWFSDSCSSSYGFYCYRFLILVKEKKTWKEADQYCRTHYTGLASVTSQTSLNQLKLETVETQTESVWTGLQFVNGIWLWVNKDQLGSLVATPSCPAPSYRCGALDTTTNTLKSHNCNDKLNFICYWI